MAYRDPTHGIKDLDLLQALVRVVCVQVRVVYVDVGLSARRADRWLAMTISLFEI
jgi:uncharacterized membrane protein YuzA (DUF378 family)